jgi:hypothetical protein
MPLPLILLKELDGPAFTCRWGHFLPGHTSLLPPLEGQRTLLISCQLGVIFTDPVVPHCLQTKRHPTHD